MAAQRLAPTRAERPGWRIPQGRVPTLLIMAATAAVIVAVTFVVNRPTTSTATGTIQRVDLVGSPTGPAPIVGQPAPRLLATDVDGSEMDLADLAGRPVWLTFGATWCQPCRAENPDIQAAYEAFKASGLVVVQIYMNEDKTTVADYASRVGLGYTRVPDADGRLSIEYRILGIPTHFFIDRSGVLTQMKVGTLDRAGMDAILADLTR